MGNTNDDLKEAFAGESQANRKYLFFAEKAEKEGLSQVARLFRATAEAETVHARNHLRALEGINSTRDNLMEAISGENYEYTKMYPGFIEQAKSEKNQKAEISFMHANAVEKIHHDLYQETLKAVESGESIKDEPYYVCQVCGNTVAGAAPDKCPVCGAPKSQFKLVD